MRSATAEQRNKKYGVGSPLRIIRVLREVEAGRKATTSAALTGSARATYYQWKFWYGGMMPSQLKHLKVLEAELSR